MNDEFARFAYLAALLLFLGGFLLIEFRRSPGRTSRGVLAWGLIFLALIAGAGLWEDVRNRVAPRQQIVSSARIEVPLGNDGHFHLVAEVNGTPVRFVVDTGASSLALRERDAGRAGIDPDRLAFAGRAQTANGLVDTAAVRLDSVRIGQIEDRNVPAIIIRGELDRSLMGMDYLRRFARVGFEDDRLILER
ncbi:MAG TPA: TIGR02281 family clan AA aspartic protease [Paracoccus sp. (in: a-proteobacteria)]|nr:TIGR02281 family clan AA aspartic protease [Paracoccus sp. (in: a-proteobacteria)]